MKNILFLFIILLLTSDSKKIKAFSDPNSWDLKKATTIRLATNFITNREKFVDHCYKDGKGYSIGYGSADYCEIKLRELKLKYKFLPENILRNKIRITKDVAKWKVKKFIIDIYDKLESRTYIIENFDEIELIALFSFVYTFGETKFYKSSLFEMVNNYDSNESMKCLSSRKMFLDYSYVNKKKSIGAFNRRNAEMILFTYKNCVF